MIQITTFFNFSLLILLFSQTTKYISKVVVANYLDEHKSYIGKMQ